MNNPWFRVIPLNNSSMQALQGAWSFEPETPSLELNSPCPKEGERWAEAGRRLRSRFTKVEVPSEQRTSILATHGAL